MYAAQVLKSAKEDWTGSEAPAPCPGTFARLMLKPQWEDAKAGPSAAGLPCPEPCVGEELGVGGAFCVGGKGDCSSAFALVLGVGECGHSASSTAGLSLAFSSGSAAMAEISNCRGKEAERS